MPKPAGFKKLCPVCGHLLDAKQFYRTNNTEKYPDGHLDTCKKCATLLIDNFNPDTFLPILEECDVPYVEKEWTASLLKYKNDPDKLTSMSVLGRYLAKMQLSHWRNYRWADTGKIEEEQQQARDQYLRDSGYTEEEIAEAREKDALYDQQSQQILNVIKERADTFKEAEQNAVMQNMLNSGELKNTGKRGPGRPKKEPIIAPSLRTLGLGQVLEQEKAKNKMFEQGVRDKVPSTREILRVPTVPIPNNPQPYFNPEDEARMAINSFDEKTRSVGGGMDMREEYEEDASAVDPRNILVNPYFEDDLTEDDKKYLSIKWGNYSPQEWVQLEKLYKDMCNSYDIQTAGHENDLKLVCKTSLKTNQLLDLGDIAGAAQAARMYDSLMKNGKFLIWTVKNFSHLPMGVKG